MSYFDSLVTSSMSHYVDLTNKVEQNQDIVNRLTDKISSSLRSAWEAISTLIFYLCIPVSVPLCIYDEMFKRAPVFENPILNHSVNEGKLSDQKIYDILKVHPLPLKEEGKTWLTSLGCQLGMETTISPLRTDDGKCQGGVTYFLSERQKNRPVQDIASDLRDGVPISASICQEIYHEIGVSWQPTKLMNAIVDAGKQAQKNPTYAFSADLWKIQGFSNDDVCILEGIHEHARTYDPSTQAYACSPLDFVKQWVGCFDVKLQDFQWWALKYANYCLIDSKSGPARLTVQDITLSLAGLEIEGVIEGPEEILEALPQLDAGDYQLNYPFYNSRGNHIGSHTVGLTIEKDGFSYLYEPNRGTGWMAPWENQRTETVKRLLKQDTGYFSKKISRMERMMNIFLRLPNYPTDPQKQHTISLYKVRKIKNNTYN